jgi:hypothetical protein
MDELTLLYYSIANLPSPMRSYSTPPMRMVTGRQCIWCKGIWLFKDDPNESVYGTDWHPDNNCLWPRALKKVSEDGKSSSSTNKGLE